VGRQSFILCKYIMKKRILYVITKSNFGGAQRYVFELACASREAGHEVAVASASEGLLVTKLREVGITHYPINGFQRDINISKELGVFAELRKTIEDYDPQVVHLNSSKAGAIGAVVCRLTGVSNIIFTAHGWPFLEKRSLIAQKVIWLASYITALLAHQVILVSKNDREHTHMPFTKKKLHVIHTAVPAFTLIERQRARQILFSIEAIKQHAADLWLVTVAELTANKNLHTAISAVAEHNQKNNQKIFYTILGDGELRVDLQNHIEALGVQEHITLAGYTHDARSYLKAFDVFLLASHKEGLPYALLEAGYAGLSCVASNVGGIPEVIEHECSGLLSGPNDIPGMVRNLTTYTSDITLRKAHAAKLHAKITSEFNIDHMIKETLGLY